MNAKWIIRDTLGALILLSAIVTLPVAVSDYLSPREMPFQPRAPQQSLDISRSSPETNRAMRSCVGSQLQLIQRSQLSEAYAYASEGIQQVLSLDDFMGMIDERFAPMKHYDIIEMSDGLDDGTQGILRVRLSRHREVIGVYTYILLLEEDQWKIGGVIPEYPHPVSLEQGMAPPE